jgi:CIC family chloride channel protein
MTVLNSRVIRIATASVLGGMLIGVVGGAFRYCLIISDNLRSALVVWAHGTPYAGWVLPVALGAAGAWLARLLVVKFAPTAEGSGIQRVEAVFSGEIPPAAPGVVPVKFVGGLLAMGSGLALGREGPTVQMDCLLWFLGLARSSSKKRDRKVVDAASAGADSRWPSTLRSAGPFCLRGTDQQFHPMALGGHLGGCFCRRLGDASDAG